MEGENSSVKQANETSESSCIWTELKVVQSIVIQSRLIQITLRLLESFLWIVEKCVEWSLPSEEISRDENGKAVEKPELVRPLPWILFLPSLIILRMIRVSLNIIILLLGFSLITPSDMVRLVQKIRRYLNDMKSSVGTKGRYCSKDKRSSMSEAKRALIKSIRLTLSSLSCLDGSKPSLSPPPTKIHVSSVLDIDAATTTSEEKSVTESMGSIKRRYSTDSSESERDEEREKTLQEQLDQLTSSGSDSEYIASSTGRDNSSICPDPDTSVSSTELNDIIRDAKEWREEQKERSIQQRFLDAERAAACDEKAVTSTEQAAEQKSSAKVSCDRIEGHHPSSRRIDSPEYHTSDRSSQEGDSIFYSPISSDGDTPRSSAPIARSRAVSGGSLKTAEFVNGEIRFSSSSAASESKSPDKTDNGAVLKKRCTNANKCQKGKRTSHGSRKKK